MMFLSRIGAIEQRTNGEEMTMVPAKFHFPERTDHARSQRSDAPHSLGDTGRTVLRFPLERVRRAAIVI